MYKAKRKGEEFEVLVSEEDEDLLRDRRWCVNAGGYAVRGKNLGPKENATVYLHREIAHRMGIIETGKEVDHINRDKLDNRRSNLRKATHTQNAYNTSRPGVSWDKSRGKWKAQIHKSRKLIWSARFEDRETAIRERYKKAQEIFGEFAPCP